MTIKVNGTLINYYIHCKRQCWLHANKINLEDNSELVKIGKALHEVKSEENKKTELSIDNIKIDRLTREYLTEIKKSDADFEASKWQVIYYLKVLRDKGIERKGRLEFLEKNKTKNSIILELDGQILIELESIINSMEILVLDNAIPPVINKAGCKKCSYYEYCYI